MRWLRIICRVALLLCIYSVLILPTFAAQPLIEISSQDGFPQSTSYSIFSPPVFYNLDADVDMEIIVASEHIVYVYDTSGTLLWSEAAGIVTTVFQTAPIVGDIDGDGEGEVVTLGLESMAGSTYNFYNNVYMFNTTNDRIRIASVDGGDEVNVGPGSPALIDLDNDNVAEIVVATEGKYTGARYHSPQGLYAFDDSSIIWFKDLPYPTIRTTTPAIGDVDNDGNSDVVVTLNGFSDIIAYSVNGTGASEIWRKDITSSDLSTTSAAIGNVSGSANNEVIVAADNGVFALKGTDGSEIWHTVTDPITHSSPVIGDIDNDGSNDIAIGSDTGKVYAFDGSGNIMPGFPVSAERDVWSTPALVDLDGDGKKEIIVGSWDGNVHAWYSDGTIVNGFPIDVGSVISSSPVVADIDNDGDLELAIGADNFNVYVWNLNVKYPPVVSINSPNQSSVFDYGELIEFNGSATDVDGTIVAYSWVSDKDGVIGTSDLISTSSLISGIHNIVFSASDNDGAERSTSLQININAPPGSDTPSGGASGGGGTTGETYENIAVKDVKSEQVNKGTKSLYEFDSIIEAVEFTGKTNAGTISVTIEELHHTSVYVNKFVDGKVYKNINIWVGNAGYATEDNIEDVTVRFLVERSWTKMNNVDKSTIKLNRYHDDKWNPLDTELVDEDDLYLYYISITPGFSPFAITGTEKVIITQVQSLNEVTSDVSDQMDISDDSQMVPKETDAGNVLPAFSLGYAFLAFAVVAIVGIARKRFGFK